MKTKHSIKDLQVITLGCSKNLVDSQVLMRQLQAGGYKVYDENSTTRPQAVIINTCGFINDAKEESIETILDYARARKNGDIEKLVVMGCLSQRYKKDLKNEIHEVDEFFGVSDLKNILNTFQTDYKTELMGERTLPRPAHYAYLKISEGCDRTCSFCAIPLIRGKHISKPIDELVKEAEFLASQGVNELMLIAQELNYYGLDLYKKRMLADLLKELVKVDGIEWIRLHYAYPVGLTDDVLELISNHPKICKYLDIPLQHISDPILKSMRRGHTGEETHKVIQAIREKVPGIALRTTLIVGYPGETEKHFEELLDFVKASKFERLGVFTYSHEEDTAAYKLEDDVPEEVKQGRAAILMDEQQKISLELNEAKIGKSYKVTIDRKEGGFWVARSEFDSPDVDNEILIPSDGPLEIGSFYLAKIISAEPFDLIAEVTG
ncbi:MAG: 30S ribosomal protein S12 methylthiotransferase RimO [Bacteroidetes bacterium 4572_114]|nr:MAG: 30S ribosomal protein S12 methylthiotransferase RimO [Bacteroidetes bacterium 4572_114]